MRKLSTINYQLSAGFTLIEILVVITILGLLSTVGLNSFRLSQLKSRDARRKSDLAQVQRALEMYLNDYGSYPVANGGNIGTFVWGGEMKDIKDTVYMIKLPNDPTANPEYCYNTDANGLTYQLYARLENGQDPKCLGGQSMCAVPQGTCNGQKIYNYGVSSSSATP